MRTILIARPGKQAGKLLALSLLCLGLHGAIAQNNPDVLNKMLGKSSRYSDIEKTILDYYSTHDNGRGSGYNQWLRWLWWNRDRTDNAGNITNTTKKALSAMDRLSLQGPAQNAMTSWQNLGPTSVLAGTNSYGRGIGRVDRIAFHPTIATTFYAGTTGGGLWRTTNGGSSWVSLSHELFTPGIAGIVVSYADPNTLYILTGDGETPYGYFNYMGPGNSTGVYKSTNGGSTWTQQTFPNVPDNYRGFRLVQDPANANVLYAATSVGLFCTQNGGASWTQMLLGASRTRKFNDIVFAGNASYVYLEEGLPESGQFTAWYRASDTSFFALATSGTKPAGVGMAMAVSANSGNTVLAMDGNPTSGLQRMYKGTLVTNANPILTTVSFTTLFSKSPNVLGGQTDGSDTTGQSGYDICMTVKPTDAQVVVTGGLCIWRSTNQGSNFSAVTKYFETVVSTLPYVHPDVHLVTYNPLNNYLYTASDGGIYVSTDDGTTWSDITAGINATQYYNVAGADAISALLLGGAQDNGTSYRKSNNSIFTHIRGADGYSTQISQLDNNYIYWTENTGVWRSPDGGTTVKKLYGYTACCNSGNFPEVRLYPNRKDTIFAFSGGNSGYAVRSTNGGAKWDTVLNSPLRDLDILKDGSNQAYIAAYGALYKVSNLFAATWSATKKFSGLSGGTTKVVVYANNVNLLWAAGGGYIDGQKVYQSADDGGTWENITGSLPNLPINCMAADASATLYVGTDIGVFIKGLFDADWTPYNNGLPRVPVTGIYINQAAGLLRISTLGRGFFSTNLVLASSLCPPTDNIISALLGQNFFQASGSINTTSSISSSAGTVVGMRAGNYVTMSPGFVANQGTVFQASVGPCNSGIITPLQMSSGSASTTTAVAPTGTTTIDAGAQQKTGPKQLLQKPDKPPGKKAGKTE